jgi:adenylate cyclase class 2
MDSYTETEIKVEIQETDLQEVRRRFEELGCRQKVVRTREENLLFDGPDKHLKNSGSALRLRQYGAKCLLTFKGPRVEDERLKIREEIETEVDDFQASKNVLERIGFRVCFEYGKYREKLQLQVGSEEVEICIDETPVGCFVEIEGSAASIEYVASSMGWTSAQYLNRNYIDLYRERLS